MEYECATMNTSGMDQFFGILTKVTANTTYLRQNGIQTYRLLLLSARFVAIHNYTFKCLKKESTSRIRGNVMSIFRQCVYTTLGYRSRKFYLPGTILIDHSDFEFTDSDGHSVRYFVDASSKST